MSYRFYSSQRPEGKVQASDLERLGDSREPSLRGSCRQHGCLSRLHHYLHHCPGCFTFDVSISGQKILFFVYMLSFGLPQVECGFGGARPLLFLFIIGSYTWMVRGPGRYLRPVTNCLHFCSVVLLSHLWEVVGAVFSLKWGDSWEELLVLPHVCTELR